MSKLVFDVLKRCLRAKGMTYRDLADRLGVSEPTIKRLFHEKDCKIGRLEDICSAIGVDLESVFLSTSSGPEEGSRLSPDLELHLAASPSLLGLVILLSQGFTSSYIQKVTGLDRASLFLYFRDLERLGLLLRGREMEVRLTIPVPIQWNPDGPLGPLLRGINLNFTRMVLEQWGAPDTATAFLSFSRRMRSRTAERLKLEAEALFERAKVLAWHDQHTTPDDELIEVKWLLALGPTPHNLLGIAPHPERAASQGAYP